MPTFLENLQWRYAVKKFDAAKKLTSSQLDELLEALRLTASSYGLQPYRFVLVEDPAVRAKVREHAWGQTQITDASHLIALCAVKTLDEKYVDHYIDAISKVRGVPVENLKGFKDMMMGTINGKSSQELLDWSKKQTYIALGFLLSAAAHMHIDSCPMEGFDAAHVDADLGLAEEGLTVVALCPVGFRSEDDAAAAYKKVRFCKEELFLTK